eukprot:GHVN01052915.1.p1 GENE.GHVN01052915.1~~GHVN01052915.1.p1  ORF type:complete len:1067 (+),score=253.23 GHVN01052915.1:445-3645(+)
MSEEEQSWEEAYAVAYARVEELEAAVNERDETIAKLEKGAVSKGGDGGGDVAELESALESAIVAKEDAEQEVELYRKEVENVRLEMEAEVLERELQIIELEKTILVGGSSNLAAQAAAHEIATYHQALNKVKEMYQAAQSQLAAKEEEAEDYLNTARSLHDTLLALQRQIESDSYRMQDLETTTNIDAKLISECQQYETELEEALRITRNELVGYREAFAQLSKISKQRDDQWRNGQVVMTAKLAKLEEEIKMNEKFLAPRWQRLAMQKEETQTASAAAASAVSGVARCNSSLMADELKFVFRCMPRNLMAAELADHNFVLSFFRQFSKCWNFLEYLSLAHYKELVDDASNNKKAVSKDKGFIRWMQTAEQHIVTAATWLVAAFEGLRMASPAEFYAARGTTDRLDSSTDPPKGNETPPASPQRTTQITDVTERGDGGDVLAEAVDKLEHSSPSSTSPTTVSGNRVSYLLDKTVAMSTNDDEVMMSKGLVTMKMLTEGEKIIDRLIEAASNDYLSSAIDTTDLENYAVDLKNVMGSDVMKPIVDHVEVKSGALAPTALQLKRFEALCVMGVGGAALSDSVAEALGGEQLSDLWKLTSNVLHDMNVSEAICSGALHNGFGIIQPRHNAKQMFAKMYQAIDGFEALILSIEEKKEDDVVAAVLPHIEVMHRSLMELGPLVTTAAPSPFPHKLPYESSIAAVQEKLANVSRLEAVVADERNLVKLECEKRDELVLKLTDAEAQVNKWQSMYKDVRMKAEKATMLEHELKNLRGTEQHYADMLQESKMAIHQGDEIKKRLQTELDELRTKAEEMTKKLEQQKKMPKHLNQSEWDAQEIANLRAIIAKLEANLYEAEVRNAAEFLGPADELEEFVSSRQLLTFDTAEASTAAGNSGDDSDNEGIDIEADRDDDIEDDEQGASADKATARGGKADNPQEGRGVQDVRRAYRMLEDYRGLQQAMWVHAFNVPVWNPSMDAKDNDQARLRYEQEHHSLHYRVATLRKRVDKYLQSRLEGVNAPKGFAEHTAAAASRYIRAFTDLAGLNSVPNNAFSPNENAGMLPRDMEKWAMP